MITDHLDLYEMILEALEKEYPSQNSDETVAMKKLAGVATLGAIGYIAELEEAVAHLRDSVKRAARGN
jgi:hypothetical protein